MRRLLVPATLLLALIPALRAGEAAWLDDLAPALVQAKAAQKDILVDFTGSDWCVWCQRLDKEVFSAPGFAAGASQLILVKLDFPQQKPMPAATKARNDANRHQFGIKGFPTLVLLDSDGREYGRLGYVAGGPTPFLAKLQELAANKAKIVQLRQQAVAAQGPARARLLDQLLDAANAEQTPYGYTQEVTEIRSLDADGKLGLLAKYEGRLRLAELALLLESKPPAEVLARIDEEWKDLRWGKPMRQELLQLKVYALLKSQDLAGARKIIDEAVALVPESKIAQELGNLAKRIDEVLLQKHQ